MIRRTRSRKGLSITYYSSRINNELFERGFQKRFALFLLLFFVFQALSPFLSVVRKGFVRAASPTLSRVVPIADTGTTVSNSLVVVQSNVDLNSATISHTTARIVQYSNSVWADKASFATATYEATSKTIIFDPGETIANYFTTNGKYSIVLEGVIDANGNTVTGWTSTDVDSHDFTFGTVATDSSAPVISAVNYSSVTDSAATFTWHTDEAATYSVSAATHTYFTAHPDTYDIWSPVTRVYTDSGNNHTLTLSGLLANTIYHFRVISTDTAGNAVQSADATFVTAADATAPTLTLTAPSGVSGNVILTANEALDPTTVSAANVKVWKCVTDSYAVCPLPPVAVTLATPALSNGDKTITLNPSGSLQYSTRYFVTAENVKDTSGNLLTGWTWTTNEQAGHYFDTVNELGQAYDVTNTEQTYVIGGVSFRFHDADTGNAGGNLSTDDTITGLDLNVVSVTSGNTAPSGKKVLSAYDITAYDQAKQPFSSGFKLSLTIPYPSGYSYQSGDVVAYWTGSQWSTVEELSHTTSAITVDTTHFSEYAILQAASTTSTGTNTTGTNGDTVSESGATTLPATGASLLNILLNMLLAVSCVLVLSMVTRRTRLSFILE